MDDWRYERARDQIVNHWNTRSNSAQIKKQSLTEERRWLEISRWKAWNVESS